MTGIRGHVVNEMQRDYFLNRLKNYFTPHLFGMSAWVGHALGHIRVVSGKTVDTMVKGR